MADQVSAADMLVLAAKQLTSAAKMMTDQISMTPEPKTRSTLLRRIQNKLSNDGKVSSEMRAFCELCEEANLEPLTAMSKDELISLSGGCREAIAQCKH